MGLFSQHFKVVKPYSQAPSSSYHCTLDIGETHGAFPIIKWIGGLFASSVYGAVQIGKTIYKVKCLFFIYHFIFYLTLTYIARRSCNCTSW
jgi:hypothetical protein